MAVSVFYRILNFMGSPRYKYHAFVSHAVLDKLPIANDLCKGLEDAGLDIWYSGKELKAGDSLEKTILKALDQSEYGIVILSPTFVERNWTLKEYYLLLAKEIKERKVILPVLFNITVDELAKYDIAIADKWAIRFDGNVDVVVQKLLDVIRGEKELPPPRPVWMKVVATLAFLLLGFVAFLAYGYIRNLAPSDQVIVEAIEKRIREVDRQLDSEHNALITEWKAIPSTLDKVKKIFTDHWNLKTNYRNAYEFENGFRAVQSRKNVEAALMLDLDSITPMYAYSLSSPEILLASGDSNFSGAEVRYAVVNKQPLTYLVGDEKRLENGDYEVSVSYRNNIRYVWEELVPPRKEDPLKRHRMSLKGYLPVEKYVFEKRGDQWVLKSVN